MRKTLITTLVVTAGAALALVATASGARSSAAAIPGCSPASLNLLKDGTLTVGADNPAYPPWFGGAEKKPWKISNPYSGKGYESAVAYAVAKQLGLPKSAVEWTYVPFNNSYRPGKKPFDFYITQVSITPERAKTVDFSRAYYFNNQSVVARKGTPIAKAKSVAGLREYKLGAQVGTTSYTYITRRSADLVARGLRHQRRRHPGAQERPDRRHRRRPPDRLLRHRRTARRRRDRRQAADQGCARALRDRVPEGQPAAELRQPGDREPLGERDDQEDRQGLAPNAGAPDLK